MDIETIAALTGGEILGRIKTKAEYNWFKYVGKRNIVVTHGNGKTTATIEPMDVFGLRLSSDLKHYRMVTQKTGLTKVFTIPETTYKTLVAHAAPSKIRVVPHRVAADLQ